MKTGKIKRTWFPTSVLKKAFDNIPIPIVSETCHSSLVDTYLTPYTSVEVWATNQIYNGERLFVIVSRELKSKHEYIRFGNQTQSRSIMNTYRKEKKFHL